MLVFVYSIGFMIPLTWQFCSNIYHVLMGESEVADIVLKTGLDHLDIFPSSHDLIGAEIELIQVKAREKILKSILQGVRENYEYILIDCPPSLGILTLFRGLMLLFKVIV